MTPVIALVGRPNVGKSTLFNQLTRSRDALVADFPGLTRDRIYGRGQVEGRAFIVIDTGGLADEAQGVEALMAHQTRRAVDEADLLVLVVDGRAGPTAGDQQIAGALRRTGKPVIVAVNKTDGVDPEQALMDFFSLGLSEAPLAIAASQGRGVAQLAQAALAAWTPPPEPGSPAEDSASQQAIRVAIVGRPNVGKSTLVNRLVGEERVLAFDLPGTTRDSVRIPFQHQGRSYLLVDTAGVRRRARIREAIEKFSVVKALQAIDESHVVVLVLDAQQGVAEQDATLLGHVVESGRALMVAVNKWDGLDSHMRTQVKSELQRRLSFVDFAELHFISALHGSGVGHLLEAAQRAYAAAIRDFSTPELSRILETAVTAHQPPLVRGRRVKLRYAHQGGKNPPRIVVHGSRVDLLPAAYRRYLTNRFRKALDLSGTPLRMEFRAGANPYVDEARGSAKRPAAGRGRARKGG